MATKEIPKVTFTTKTSVFTIEHEIDGCLYGRVRNARTGFVLVSFIRYRRIVWQDCWTWRVEGRRGGRGTTLPPGLERFVRNHIDSLVRNFEPPWA